MGPGDGDKEQAVPPRPGSPAGHTPHSVLLPIGPLGSVKEPQVAACADLTLVAPGQNPNILEGAVLRSQCKQGRCWALAEYFFLSRG